MPTLDMDGLPLVLDEDGLPLDDAESYDRAGLEYPLELWQPAAVDGQVYEVGVLPLSLRADVLENVRAAQGGFLAKYLLPHVVEREQQNNPSAKGSEAWGWLPPPLLNEGRKVQTNWLHDFLLNPTVIRPAAVMRMPRYNLSPDEAAMLVRYFAMISDGEYPYEFRSRRQADYLTAAQQRYQAQLPVGPEPNSAEVRTRLGDALRIVKDANYCIKCHRVGDYEPQTCRPRQGARSRSGVSASAARLRTRLDRQSQSAPAVYRHADQHSLRSRTPGFGRDLSRPVSGYQYRTSRSSG